MIMTTGFHHDTAKIYQFPVASRRQNFGQRTEGMSSSVLLFPEPVQQYAVVDTCWSHQEALTTDDKSKN